MRIRKRKVPLPLSLLSPIPLTDPHLFSRSPVMMVQTEAPTASSNNTVNHTSSSIFHDSQPSDHLTKSWSSDLRRLIVANTAPNHHDVMEVKGVLTNNDDASNLKLATTKNTNGAAPHHLSPSTNEEEGRWCEGDKAIPLKKRRGMSFSNINVDPSTQEEQEIKSSQNNNNDNNNNNNNNKNNNNNGISGKKGNSKRGNTIMEGSRCSRVNGRGWRCCQPTLVGYSLCEHHLGKGRLRSITTNSGVKAKSSTTKKKRSSNTNNEDQKVEHVHEHNDKKNERTTMKLGVVKARSLSSLLSQTNTINIAGDDNNDHASPHQHQQTTVTNLDHS